MMVVIVVLFSFSSFEGIASIGVPAQHLSTNAKAAAVSCGQTMMLSVCI